MAPKMISGTPVPPPIPTPLEEYEAAVLADNPVAFWPLQDASGDLEDISGNNLPFTVHTGIDYQFSAGPIADTTSIRIQGGEVISRDQISAATDNLTLEFWIHPIDVLDVNQGMMANQQGGLAGYTVLLQGGTLKWRVVAQSVGFLNESAGAVVEDAWNYLVITRDAGTWKYYLNGVVDTANAGNANPGAPVGGTTLLNGANSITALYACAAFYDTALSAAQVAAHYAASGL
jgi:hypothetical protein